MDELVLLIFPGGDFVAIGNSLTPRTTANIRSGVQNGLNYLGVSAGAFLAGSFAQPYKSLNLTSGVQFGFYAATLIQAAPNRTSLSHF